VAGAPRLQPEWRWLRRGDGWPLLAALAPVRRAAQAATPAPRPSLHLSLVRAVAPVETPCDRR